MVALDTEVQEMVYLNRIEHRGLQTENVQFNRLDRFKDFPLKILSLILDPKHLLTQFLPSCAISLRTANPKQDKPVIDDGSHDAFVRFWLRVRLVTRCVTRLVTK